MRRIALFFAFTFFASLAFAQNSNVRKAESALENGNLDEAKALIALATEHEKTKDDGKTWYVRGSIYQAELRKAYNEEAVKEAVKSFDKVMELESEGSNYYTLTDLKIQEIWGGFINKGSESYSAKEYADALGYFEKALLVLPEDTTATLYAGISAQQGEDIPNALKYYYRLLDLDYHAEDIYGSIISLERYINKDIDKALEVVNLAIKQFPNDDSFEKTEINILITAERVDEAKDKLNNAIAKEPNNANLYFSLGYLYEELEQPAEAEKAYLKAIEIDPEYKDANFNYAIFNYNIAADLISKVNDMDLQTYRKEGKKIEAEAMVYMKKSKPYFEKALELSPDELMIIETLQTVYTQLKELDKAEEMMNRADALKAKNEGGE